MGDDLAGYIRDHYLCPICNKMYVGLMSWASHTAQVHHLYVGRFEEKYGYKKYFYGVSLIEEVKGEIDLWNPSKREEKELKKNS